MSVRTPLNQCEPRSRSNNDESMSRLNARSRRAMRWCGLATVGAVTLSVFSMVTLRMDFILLSASIFETILLLSAGVAAMTACWHSDRFLLIPFILVAGILMIIRFMAFILAMISAIFPENYADTMNLEKKWKTKQSALVIPLSVISVWSALLAVVLYLAEIRALSYYMALVERVERDAFTERSLLLPPSNSTYAIGSNSSMGTPQSSASGSDERQLSVTPDSSSNDGTLKVSQSATDHTQSSSRLQDILTDRTQLESDSLSIERRRTR